MNLKDHQTAVENWTTTYKDLLNLIQQGAKQTFNKVVNLDKKEKFDNSGMIQNKE